MGLPHLKKLKNRANFVFGWRYTNKLQFVILGLIGGFWSETG